MSMLKFEVLNWIKLKEKILYWLVLVPFKYSLYKSIAWPKRTQSSHWLIAISKAKFKELQPQLKFKTRLKYGWFQFNVSRFKSALDWNRFLADLRRGSNSKFSTNQSNLTNIATPCMLYIYLQVYYKGWEISSLNTLNTKLQWTMN